MRIRPLMPRTCTLFSISGHPPENRPLNACSQDICNLMVQMIAGDVPPLGEDPITLCEPACGAGAMILAFAKALPPESRRRLLVTATDINKTACDMCFIKTTLWGIPAEIIHGDTIASKFFAGWRNIHWCFLGRLSIFLPALAATPVEAGERRSQNQEAMPQIAALIASAVEQQGRPPSPEKIEQLKTALGQQEFTLE